MEERQVQALNIITQKHKYNTLAIVNDKYMQFEEQIKSNTLVVINNTNNTNFIRRLSAHVLSSTDEQIFVVLAGFPPVGKFGRELTEGEAFGELFMPQDFLANLTEQKHSTEAARGSLL